MLVNDPPAALTETLWMLGTHEYPLYLFRDPAAGEGILFEGGTGAMGPLLAGQLETLGIDPAVVGQVVVTHAHPDHVMAVPMFRRLFPAASVLASSVAAATLSAEKAVAFFGKVDEALTASLLKSGTIRPEPPADKIIAVDRVIGEGDTVAAGRAAFGVLATPGHSDCSLSFHEPDLGILVISDATGYYMPDRGAWWPNYFAGYAAYVESMRRLSTCRAEVLCLSHNGAIRGADEIAAYFRGAIEATGQYHERIVADARAGRPARQIAEALGAEIYQHTQRMPLEFFQKNCALLVKQSLAHEGIGQEK